MPVSKWNNEIQTGVYNMTCMAIELIALKLKEDEVPELLLNTLTTVLLLLLILLKDKHYVNL